MRIPNHIGIIPDGNRRWAIENGMAKDKGYEHGLEPGLRLLKQLKAIGVKEITYYGLPLITASDQKINIRLFLLPVLKQFVLCRQ